MLVYRLENEYGYGPYSCFFPLAQEMTDKHQDRTSLKCVSYKLIVNTLYDIRDWFCGMSSLEGLKEWFDGYIDRLINEHDFHVVVYDVDETYAYIKDGQVFFVMDEAEFLEDITEHFNATQSNLC